MIRHSYLDSLRKQIREKNNSIADKRIRWIRNNRYYYSQLIRTLKFIIPEKSSVMHVRCGIGYVLDKLKPSKGVGVDESEAQVDYARRHYADLRFVNRSIEEAGEEGNFDYILVSSVEDIIDIKSVLDSLHAHCTESTRVVIYHYNFLWFPLVRLAELLNMKLPQRMHNWISSRDLENILGLSDFETIYQKRTILFPFRIPVLSFVINRIIARLPFFSLFAMIRVFVARPKPTAKEYSVSVIVPCRNEAGNIEDAVKRIPKLGSHTEILFGDDKSTDGTPEKVKEMIARYPEKDIKLIDSPGICKAMNVWTCFDHASCDVLMILDADLTVIPEELPYFYEAIATGKGEFINGSRMVYPMHKEAMRFFNVIGNKFFSLAFSYILGFPIKDTLCGTKVIRKADFEKVKRLRGFWGINDRWGDYELIFGAVKSQLKVVDLPVHYTERLYGETKMTNRLRNGWIMLRMCYAALIRIKFH